MRSKDYCLNLQEFANFLATAAQETTGAIEGSKTKYQTDGLYWRYESDWLVSNGVNKGGCLDVPENPGYWKLDLQSAVSGCNALGLAVFKTTYYPLSTFVVAVKNGTTLVNTTLVTDSDRQYNTSTNTFSFPGYPLMPAKWPGG
jgi:hypothetical protein